MPATKMSILIVTQYFWPENMRINDLVRDLSEKGHQVTVLTGLPNYPEGKIYEDYKTNPSAYSEFHGAKIVRVPHIPRGKNSITLMLNYLTFFLMASVVGPWKLRAFKFNSIFVYAVSPIMAAIPALLIGRIKKAPVFVWVLDLWPETLRAVGVIRHPKLLSVVGRMVSWIYNRADYLLIQSNGFFENVRGYCTKYMSPERIIYFPSWAEDDFSNAHQVTTVLLDKNDSVFTVVFAGNIGEAQDFPAIVEAAQILLDKVSVRWVIVGDGRMSEWLVTKIEALNLENFLLLGRHPLHEMPGLFACADALLVSLKTNDVFEKTIPGKVQAYLASGKPIIGMIDGEAARVINESGAGLSCDSGDATALSEIIFKLASMSSDSRQRMGKAGREYYLDNFNKTTLLNRLGALFQDATLRKDSK